MHYGEILKCSLVTKVIMLLGKFQEMLLFLTIFMLLGEISKSAPVLIVWMLLGKMSRNALIPRNCNALVEISWNEYGLKWAQPYDGGLQLSSC
jgi:hypothetical protein